jgi:alpha-amylase
MKLETIGAPGEAVQPSEYLGVGDPQEFTYAYDLKRVFSGEKLAYLKNFGEDWGYLPSDKASVFVTNHDTERNGRTLTYKDGATYTLAQVFSLAWPYGAPDVHSGYSFTDTAAGGPNGGQVNACYTDGWKCQHAWREVASMVAWRNTAHGEAVTDWWDNGNNQIAFGRGSKAYVAINHEGGSLTRTFQTSLPAGDYCDVQSGKGVTVNSAGQFTATLGANTALALHVGAKTCGGGSTDPEPAAGASFRVNATTSWGENIYVTGDNTRLGDWNPDNALKLDPAAYPVWKLDVSLPAGTSFEYKYLRKDANGKVTWESGANRTATVSSSGTVVLGDTWRD